MENLIEVNFDNMDEVFDEMLDAQCEELKKEQDEVSSEQASNVLEKFKDYIQSRRFDNQCKEKAKEIGVKNYKIVKNRYIAGVLGKIANILGLVLDITAEVMLYAVEFLSKLIRATINLASSICHKIINLFTLNCGSMA